MLAACGAGQTPIGASPSISAPDKPSSGALLYVVMSETYTHVLTYPGFREVKHIPYWGLSTSDPNNGDVMIGGIEWPINLYAYGGKKPLRRFGADGGAIVYDSAFDPTSGFIAISENEGGRGASVSVCRTPKSKGTRYVVPHSSYVEFVGYDGKGNLFVDGIGAKSNFLLAELPKGGKAFVNLSVVGTISNAGAIQWDGKYLTVASGPSIYRLQVSGLTATVVGQTTLLRAWGGGVFWIEGDTVIGPHLSHLDHDPIYLGLWHYPGGGEAYKIITSLSRGPRDYVNSATVSLAPSR
ncbi:MAG TPA: hypothetical protein VIW73_02465 [Candidatus Cybelea sp.]